MHCRTLLAMLFLTSLSFLSNANTEKETDKAVQQIESPLYKPLVERYILDELKQLRQDQQATRAELIEKVVNAKLESSDRAIRYTADTTNTIFYIITAAASILVLLGWKSIRDIKESMEASTTRRIEKLTAKYEDRLNQLEDTIKERSNQIVEAQKVISESNMVHSLWMRAGLEKSDQEKLNIYDQILEINPHDVEALTYKADLLLDMNDDAWALSLVNQAIELDSNYALAYWQRACAKSKLAQSQEALEDIRTALTLSSTLKEELDRESYFSGLRKEPAFIALQQA